MQNQRTFSVLYLKAETASGLESKRTFFSLSWKPNTLLLTNGDSRFATEMSACLMKGATSLKESLYE